MTSVILMASFLFLAGEPASAAAASPLACHLNALSPAELERHRVLGGKLKEALVERRDLTDGYELTLDLSRLAPDAKGSPFCVVEVAEWVDQESRCCPFLEFGISVRGGSSLARLRLSGGKNVKAFLEEEFPILSGQPR